jgi:hypothetical protein
LPLIKRLVHDQDLDPIVRLNLAICLLELREDISTCGQILQNFPVQQLLSPREDSIFAWIAKTDLVHDPAMPRLPESVDLSIRLKMLALRSFANLEIDRGELEKMFCERSWGICAQAIGFTFSKLDPRLEDVVKPLLSHETESVRIQAILLYTSINKSPEAASMLAKEYAKASKEGKETLVMGLGLLPASSSLPHLAPLLCDQSLSVRTRAAGAVLTSIYK